MKNKFALKRLVKLKICSISTVFSTFISISCSNNKANLKIKYSQNLHELYELYNELQNEVKQYYLNDNNPHTFVLNEIYQNIEFIKQNESNADLNLQQKTLAKIQFNITWIKTQRQIKTQEVLDNFRKMELFYNDLISENIYENKWMIKKYEQIINLSTKIDEFLNHSVQITDPKSKTIDKYNIFIIQINELLKTLKKESLDNKINK
ncbi:hypothetical protein MBVG596_1035 [Mycoplasmopsis bovigenitalium]|uniref:hypothetical protein n=1 Tax=Mycoplasmopsis bovigenitalium TaxID=2112 RepID=UPI00090BC7CB|nr:hypothetical protein [Mycoplasmopsis bovigenitalium]BAW18532.1 hypothetical protein MBVG596_1035 [Mycoplasmopsis bovigenitalium]